jgi:hypothetical protein
VADTGGLGRSITEEMRMRYDLPMIAAEKTEKMTAIDMVNCDFVDRRLFVHSSCKSLCNQYETLTWDDKHKEDPTLPNDLCDSALYPLRFSRHYWGKIPEQINPVDKLEEEILNYAEAKPRNTDSDFW